MMQKRSLLLLSPEASAEAKFIHELNSNTIPNDSTHVFALNNMLLRLLGPDWLEWLPETIWSSLPEVPDRLTKDKILALQLCLTTNRPWVEYEVFEKVSSAFNDEIPNHSVLEPRLPEECVTTISLLHTLRPDEKFDDEVYVYVAACFAQEGYVCVGHATWLEPVQRFLDLLNRHSVSAEESAHINKMFKNLWTQPRDKVFPLIQNAEDTTEKAQLRKLYGVYTYLEQHDGLKH